jgi:hypothetical protein
VKEKMLTWDIRLYEIVLVRYRNRLKYRYRI